MIYLMLLLKLFIGFSIIFLYLKISGKSQLTNMTPIDHIGNFVIGGVMGGVIYSDSISIEAYIISLLIVLMVILSITFISKRLSVARAITIGVPLILIKHGEFCYDTIKENKNKINFVTILSKLQLQGISSLKDVWYLQLEPSGDVISIKKGEDRPSSIIYSESTYNLFNLDLYNLDVDHIKGIIEERKIEDILFIEYFCRELIVVTEKETIVININGF